MRINVSYYGNFYTYGLCSSIFLSRGSDCIIAKNLVEIYTIVQLERELYRSATFTDGLKSEEDKELMISNHSVQCSTSLRYLYTLFSSRN